MPSTFEPMALATGFVEYRFSRQNPTLARSAHYFGPIVDGIGR